MEIEIITVLKLLTVFFACQAQSSIYVDPVGKHLDLEHSNRSLAKKTLMEQLF